MDQHKQALEIYVFKIKDYGKAEEYVLIRLIGGITNEPRYCNRIHLTQDSAVN